MDRTIYLSFIADMGDEFYTLRLTIPGIVPWKDGGKGSKFCAAAFEETFSKEHWSRVEVANIGKEICKNQGWQWHDIYASTGEENIDFSDSITE
jgi:hypothetical protein